MAGPDEAALAGAAAPRRGRGGWMASPGAGAALAALCVGLLEARLRPMAVTIAQAQLQSDAARLVERVRDGGTWRSGG